MERIKKNIRENYHYISLVMLFFVALGILWHGGYQVDDYTYKQAAVCGFPQMISFMRFHFNEINGRTLIHFLVLLFLKYDWGLYVWRIICAAAVAFVCYSLGKLSSDEKSEQKRNTVLCCILYCIIEPNIWRLSVCWLTGSFNYLLPFALLTALFLRCLKKEKLDLICLILALLCGATTEQIGIMAIGFFVLTILDNLIKTRKTDLKDVIYLITSVIGYSTIWLSPGTSARSSYYSLYENNDILKNATNLLKLNWFENTGIVLFDVLLLASLVFWLIRLRSNNKAGNIVHCILATVLTVSGSGNILFNAIIYFFGYSVDTGSTLNKLVFVLWLMNVVMVIGVMVYIAFVLYLRNQSKAFIISVILGIGDQLMLILVYDNRYRTMFPSLFAFFMIILLTANEFFKLKTVCSKKIVPILLVLMLICGTGHYMIGKDSIRSLPPSSGIDSSFLDESGRLKPLSDKELNSYFEWLRHSLSKSQAQATERNDIMDFSYIPAVNKYNSR